MLPAPFDAPQAEPAEAAHVQVALVNAAGKVSATLALATALGPLLVAMIV
jgi:hypothetical protein